ncbi:Ig-like domain-containing protein [Melioribacteraceae bacterium 4301-Me]|uniref:Ig-like domain-containing protein n=1 Tax=Pyranulibacter aquaticus TaxID=3163344 RepID=UPI003599D1BF
MKKFFFLFFAIEFLTLKAQVTGLSGWNIYLDPGHSQNENVGIYGYSEAKKVLRVGLALRDYLLKETDIDTVYISRTNDDQYVTLTQRTDQANSLGAAWYHSIHSDAATMGSNVNSTLLLWGQYKNGQEKIPNGGKAMSDIMVQILTAGYRIPTRGSIGDCTFYGCTGTGPYLHVNRETTMPSELSEAGFHTNPSQNQRNMNAEWKKLEARTLFWSILKYHNIPRPPVRILTGIISDAETGIPINGATATVDTQSYTTDTYQSLFHLYSTDSTQLHNGFYYLENVPSDSLKLVVTAPGYLSDTSYIAVSDTFFTFKDVQLVSTVPPTLLSSSPTENDSIYPGMDNIVFNFSRKMNRDSVEANLIITPAAHLIFSWSNSDKTLKILTDSLKFSTNYTIKILPNAVSFLGNLLFDGNGDGIGGDTLVYNFKTKQLDQYPPKIISFYPDKKENVELRPVIRINYNEKIDFTGVTNLLKLVKASDQMEVSGSVRHYVINNKSVLHFFPSKILDSSEVYQFKILAGVKDIFGNTTAADTSINFKTGDTDFQVTSIDNFEGDFTANWWQPTASGSTVGVVPDNTKILINSSVTNLVTNSKRSMQLNYEWDTGATSWLIREYLNTGTPRNITFNKSYILQVYVFGDASNNQFRFAVDDNVPPGTTHEVSPWYTIDWSGWKLVSWDMTNDSTGSWLGDGNLDGTLRFDSFQLTHNPINGAQSGVILFDDLRVVKKIIVSVNEGEIASNLPSSFKLFQNYPNPFNPATIITYQVPIRSHVTLKVYDMLGREVATLVNEEKAPGKYNVKFNPSYLPSGVYFYKFESNNYVSVKKMIFLK